MAKLSTKAGRYMYFLGNFQKKNGQFRINNAYLCDSENGDPIVNGFEYITKNGYSSKKDVIVNLDVIDEIDGELIITDQCAEHLIDNFGQKGKTYSKWRPDSKSSVHLALCNHITDPHDNS